MFAKSKLSRALPNHKALLVIAAITFLTVFTLFVLYGCGGVISMNGKQLPIIAEWKGDHCGITEPKRTVVTDAKDWSEIWKQVHKNKIPIPEVPAVDFSENMVFAVFMGQKPTSGYAIQIDEVTRNDGVIVVKVRETESPKDTIVLQVLTQPFHIVVVPKVEGQVRFVE